MEGGREDEEKTPRLTTPSQGRQMELPRYPLNKFQGKLDAYMKITQGIQLLYCNSPVEEFLGSVTEQRFKIQIAADER